MLTNKLTHTLIGLTVDVPTEKEMQDVLVDSDEILSNKTVFGVLRMKKGRQVFTNLLHNEDYTVLSAKELKDGFKVHQITL